MREELKKNLIVFLKSEIVSRFAKLFSVDVVLKAGSFLLMPVFLNLMTADEFGRYTYMYSVAGMFAFVFGAGQHITISRFFHSSEYSLNTVSENIHIVLVLSIIFWGGILFFGREAISTLLFSFDMSLTAYCLVVVLGIFLSLNQILSIFIYQSENIALAQKKSLCDFICISGLGLLVLYLLNGDAAKLRIAANVTANLLTLLLFYRLMFNAENFAFSRRSKAICKRFMVNGIPVAFGSMANFFINFGDRFVIQKLLDTKQLGVFSFAMVIVSVLMVIFASFQKVWFPYFFKERNLDISFIRIYKIIMLFGIVCLVAGVAAYFVVNLLCMHFIDKIYLQSLDFLWVLILAAFLQIAGMLIAGFYQIYEKNYISLPVNIVAAACNILMNYILISRYQLLGAAMATALVSLALFCVHFYLVHYYKKKGGYGEYYSAA